LYPESRLIWARRQGPIRGTNARPRAHFTVAGATAVLACLWLAPSALAVGPMNQTSPYVSGEATVGHVLTAHDGTWADPQPTTRVWQRLEDGVWSDTGKTESTYTLGVADIGKQIRIHVTATLPSSEDSDPTSPIASDP